MSDIQGSHKHTNRLINETSPYLLQHAHNPVDWYPWGAEALQKAQQEDKPIFLSVGYSACHWCHVMERESFEREETADIMNRSFVSIKVDREERPDIDSIYMLAVQAMTQQGGWPMSVFLTPDGRPFYGGTYFPPHDRRYGGSVMPGFPRILNNVASAFKEHRQELEEQASELAEYLKRPGAASLRGRKGAEAGPVLPTALQVASQKLAETFDEIEGGFGSAPKFPNTMSLEVLLREHLHQLDDGRDVAQESSKPGALAIVEYSLQHMAHGGIYDQLGGGFHRYSVDDKWLVPHFEKMLYDNALLSRVYLHTYLVTGNAFYRQIAEETLDYVMREMLSHEGGFYSTQDADSEGVEGKFFVWTPAEIKQVLSAQDAELFLSYYAVTESGNFEGKNILHVPEDEQTVAAKNGVSLEELRASLERSRSALLHAREQRVRPGRDEKILTAWNGMMLRSFAEAARYLKRSDYLQVASDNARFVLNSLRKDGRLLRTYKDGRARLNGYLEDYALLADGLLALYEASFSTQWFIEARQLMDQAIELFADEEHGGFFDTGHDHEALINRPKDIMDNATPAGNSVAVDVLLRLAAFSGESAYRQRADEYLQSLADVSVQYPQSFGYLLGALDFVLSPVKEFALMGTPAAADSQVLLDTINACYLPNSVLASAEPNDTQATAAIELLSERPLKGNVATAYVCQNFACQAPVTSADELAQLL